MANIFNLANWFRSIEPMTRNKLQNMCYYAQAWSYVLCPGLIDGVGFEAWKHGYACRELYEAYKSYGVKKIPKAKKPNIFSDAQQTFLNEVWRMYGGQSDLSLKVLSHKEQPWRMVRDHLGSPNVQGAIIPTAVIKKFYSDLYGKNSSRN